MKGKELLEKVISTGYSRSTMRSLFCAGRQDEERSDKVAEIIDNSKTEQEILLKIEELNKT